MPDYDESLDHDAMALQDARDDSDPGDDPWCVCDAGSPRDCPRHGPVGPLRLSDEDQEFADMLGAFHGDESWRDRYDTRQEWEKR